MVLYYNYTVTADKKLFGHDHHKVFIFNLVYTKKLGLNKMITQDLIWSYLFFENSLSMDISPPPLNRRARQMPATST